MRLRLHGAGGLHDLLTDIEHSGKARSGPFEILGKQQPLPQRTFFPAQKHRHTHMIVFFQFVICSVDRRHLNSVFPERRLRAGVHDSLACSGHFSSTKWGSFSFVIIALPPLVGSTLLWHIASAWLHRPWLFGILCGTLLYHVKHRFVQLPDAFVVFTCCFPFFRTSFSSSEVSGSIS